MAPTTASSTVTFASVTRWMRASMLPIVGADPVRDCFFASRVADRVRSYNGPMTELAAALLYALAWTVARLPWPLLRALADAMARLSRATNGREARVARRNLELVRPELDDAGRERLLAD